jgi:alkylation response protein AidB-like acyl-CoA dehydrogenase
MDFELDDDQRELRDMARALIAKECSPAFVRAVIDDGADPAGWWRTLVELYWPALAIDERAGGLGMSWVELAIVVEELGRAIDPSPFLATTTQFVPIVRECADGAQAARWLGAVAAGEVTGTVAAPGAHGEQDAPEVTATETDGGWTLRGRVARVVDGDRADEIAVVARAGDGIGVFVVARADAAATLRWRDFETVDPSAHVVDLELTDVVVPVDRRLAGDDVAGGLERALEEATLGWAVGTVGASQRILDLVVDYVKQRHQFGQPIGAFQAVKHKVVDVYVSIERARALGLFAALTIVEGDSRRRSAVSMAKSAAGDCQRIAFQHGLQLFGGMGFTWENDLNFALRRAKAGALLFGTTSHHRRRVAREVIG